MKKRITVFKGDGVGPEVTTEAIRVLDAIASKYNHTFTYSNQLLGACAIDEYGIPLTDEAIEDCKQSDAILLGAVGDPKYDNDPNATVRPEQGLLKLRKSLALHTNVRPTTIYASIQHLSPLKKERLEDVDFVIYRELSSGIYFGKKGYDDDEKTSAFDVCSYTEKEIETVARLAFEAAKNKKGKVTLIDKANVLETSRLWRNVVRRIATEYANQEVSYLFVDNAAMQMILNPAQFDVVLTSNMFGDIISDQASVLSGSIGLAPSASYGDSTALFEPIHGSYPQAKGKNIANPVATILSAAMLLDYFELFEEANVIRSSVDFCIDKMIGTPDLFPDSVYHTDDVGELIAAIIEDENVKSRIGKETTSNTII